MKATHAIRFPDYLQPPADLAESIGCQAPVSIYLLSSGHHHDRKPEWLVHSKPVRTRDAELTSRHHLDEWIGRPGVMAWMALRGIDIGQFEFSVTHWILLASDGAYAVPAGESFGLSQGAAA